MKVRNLPYPFLRGQPLLFKDCGALKNFKNNCVSLIVLQVFSVFVSNSRGAELQSNGRR